MRALISVVILAGCGGGAATPSAVCDVVKKRCGADAVPDTCAKDVEEVKDVMGDSWSKAASCANEAKSCPEVIGCFAGGAANMLDRWQKQFDDGFTKGYGKTTGSSSSSSSSSKTGPVPKSPPWMPDNPTPTHKPSANDDWSDWSTGGNDFAKAERDMQKEMDRAMHGDATTMTKCGSFKTQHEDVDGATRARAKWSDCGDSVVRELRCAPFAGSLKCDCLEDGVEKWFFSAGELPPLDAREDAERVALANCMMGFGH